MEFQLQRLDLSWSSEGRVPAFNGLMLGNKPFVCHVYRCHDLQDYLIVSTNDAADMEVAAPNV